MNALKDKFLPKSQGARDILLLVVLIVPLAIAGVIWGILGDFSEPREPVTPTPVIAPATPQSTPVSYVIVDNA